jgi:hypothetical protein
MKKQTVYWCVKTPSGMGMQVIKKQGYLYDIIDPQGTITIGLVYVRPSWRATHYESGLDCTPYSDAGSYSKAWKKKEDLLEAVKNIDFHRYMDQAKPFIEIVNKYKEKL